MSTTMKEPGEFEAEADLRTSTAALEHSFPPPHVVSAASSTIAARDKKARWKLPFHIYYGWVDKAYYRAVLGIIFSWGVVQTSLVSSGLAQASTLAFVGGLAVFCMSAFALPMHYVIAKVGPKNGVFIGGGVIAFGQVVSGWATESVGGLFVLQGLRWDHSKPSLLGDAIGPLSSLAVSLYVAGLAIIAIWPFSTNPGSVAVFSALAGAGGGGFFALLPSVCGYVLGDQKVSSGLAWIEICGSVGVSSLPLPAGTEPIAQIFHGQYLTGGPIAGFLYQASGGQAGGISAYKPAMWFAGGGSIQVLDTPAATVMSHDAQASSSGGGHASTSKATVKVISCAPCRIRKVKCDKRLNGLGEMHCLRCEGKGLTCAPQQNDRPKKPINRGGARLELAAALYGKSGATPPEEPPAKKRKSTSPPAEILSLTAVSDRLACTELHSTVITSLLNEFLAERSTNQEYELLCSAMAALAVRTTSNPFVVGSGVSVTWDGGNGTFLEEELPQCGQNRAQVCASLTRAAIAGVDVNATLRIPSREGIVALLILERLIECLEGEDIVLDPSGTAPYVRAYLGHVHELLGVDEGIDATIAWTTLYRDRICSAFGGSRLTIDEDDIEMMRSIPDFEPFPNSRSPFSGESVGPVFVTMKPWDLFNVCYSAFLENVMDCTRFAAENFRTKPAQRAPLDEPAFEELLERITSLMRAADEVINTAVNAQLMVIVYIRLYVRSLIAGVCVQAFLAHRIVRERLDRRWSIENPGRRTEDPYDEAYWQRMEHLERRTRLDGFAAARKMVGLLRTREGPLSHAEDEVGSMHFFDWGVQSIIFEDVPKWASFIVDTPTEEQGGPPLFTFDVKVEELEVLVHALHSIQFFQARRHYAASAAFLVNQLEQVKSQRSKALEYTNPVNLKLLEDVLGPGAAGGQATELTGVGEAVMAITLTEWKQSRLKVLISVFTSILFAALIAGSEITSGPSDFEAALITLSASVGNGLDPMIAELGRVDQVAMPLGWGISVLYPGGVGGLIQNGVIKSDRKSFVRTAAYKSGVGNTFFVTSQLCVVDPAEDTRFQNASIITSYFLLNPGKRYKTFLGPHYQAIGGNQTRALYDCYTTLYHSHAHVSFLETQLQAVVTPGPYVTASSYDTHFLVATTTYRTWQLNVGSYGSQGLTSLFSQQTKFDEKNVWASASNYLYSIGATKLYNAITPRSGGTAFNGTGTNLPTTLSYTIPVFKIGAQGERTAVIIIFIACLVLCLASIGVQLLQPHWTFNPLELSSVLAVAQNSPPSAEVNGACAGKVNNVADRSSKVSYGVLSPGHLGFSWTEKLDDPVAGQWYA
ncbi:Zn(2)-C7 fungal-type transcription factor [Pseudohyphozyma bogoriensis]|nr:Zn(2)-C7 fungal-type transcription factor [Pseudohyphozyma bogoriensis]